MIVNSSLEQNGAIGLRPSLLWAFRCSYIIVYPCENFCCICRRERKKLICLLILGKLQTWEFLLWFCVFWGYELEG